MLTTTDAHVSHVYATAGTYTATVTFATWSDGPAYSNGLTVTVTAD
ncbi:hypothetical protein [Kitasatospora sp. HPMI-4]